MFALKLFGYLVMIVIGMGFVWRKPRRSVTVPARSATSSLRRVPFDIPAVHPGDYWFPTVCRLVWGLIFVSPSLFGVLALTRVFGA